MRVFRGSYCDPRGRDPGSPLRCGRDDKFGELRPQCPKPVSPDLIRGPSGSGSMALSEQCFKVGNGVLQPLAELHIRLPTQLLLRQGNVRLALAGIVLR